MFETALSDAFPDTLSRSEAPLSRRFEIVAHRFSYQLPEGVPWISTVL